MHCSRSKSASTFKVVFTSDGRRNKEFNIRIGKANAIRSRQYILFTSTVHCIANSYYIRLERWFRIVSSCIFCSARRLCGTRCAYVTLSRLYILFRTIKSSRFSISFCIISRLGSAFIFLRRFNLGHIRIVLKQLLSTCKIIKKSITIFYNRKSISSNTTPC